jgi:ABC-type sulfate transport system substrate-binding protein
LSEAYQCYWYHPEGQDRKSTTSLLPRRTAIKAVRADQTNLLHQDITDLGAFSTINPCSFRYNAAL